MPSAGLSAGFFISVSENHSLPQFTVIEATRPGGSVLQGAGPRSNPPPPKCAQLSPEHTHARTGVGREWVRRAGRDSPLTLSPPPAQGAGGAQACSGAAWWVCAGSEAAAFPCSAP